jgi:transcription-repair coupling factor (superfamily II helicase)
MALLSGLLSLLEDEPALQEARRALAAGHSTGISLPRAAWPFWIAALLQEAPRPTLIVAGTAERAQRMAQDLALYLGPERIHLLPEPPVLPYERAPWPPEIRAERLTALAALAGLNGDPAPVGVASARALRLRTLPPRLFHRLRRIIRTGQELPLEGFVRYLLEAGYEPVTMVTHPGQFARRGGILDLFPSTAPEPVRIEWEADRILSMRAFDPSTQRTLRPVEQVRIFPAREALPGYGPTAAARLATWEPAAEAAAEREALERERQALAQGAPFPTLEFYLPYFYGDATTPLAYLPEDGWVILLDETEIREAWEEVDEEARALRARGESAGFLPPDYPDPLVDRVQWESALRRRPALRITALPEEGGSPALPFEAPPRFGGQIQRMIEDFARRLQLREAVVIVSRQAGRLAAVWADHAPGLREATQAVSSLETPPLPQRIYFLSGALSSGFLFRSKDGRRLALLTDAELFGVLRPLPWRRRARRGPPPEWIRELREGDYVVHEDFGIGIFEGLVRLNLDGVEREYLVVRYAGNDRLYVPVDQADRVSRYVGPTDQPPEIHPLGGGEWAQARARARQAAAEVARELLELYARREVARGHAFSPDTPWQRELEASFPFVETEDQLRAIEEVKADMERPRPMDRLLCGDAGFGKTEVALRAAFKAVMDGKQVALLAPTTILAHQHYETFRARLAPFPVVVEVLTRLRSPREQAEILRRLREGEIDIVIGTHRLLQPDVVFRDLGLVIIDEEQRFGVMHKEHFKRLRAEVDVLTLTATPIPRTLYLALSGLRDISLIQTPPEERLPVQVYVGPYDDRLVRSAIMRELDRGGQVFVVYNRVHGLEAWKERLQALVPGARFGMAHGQMPPRQLEKTMMAFTRGEIDVLVATDIISSGLDIPNANTMIVIRADLFGLAQLYQLRGRVGRSVLQGYAYFLYDPKVPLTAEARERLMAIYEIPGLGGGFQLAMRDLEVRGAGEILGTRQHGHIAAVGFDLYMKMLNRAIVELRAEREGEPPPPAPEGVTLNLPWPIGLPEDYIPDPALRLQLYRRMAAIQTLEGVAEMARELEDRFGPLPEEARNLLQQLRFKILAARAGIERIHVEGRTLVLRPAPAGADGIARELGGWIADGALRIPRRPTWPQDLERALRRWAGLPEAAGGR